MAVVEGSAMGPPAPRRAYTAAAGAAALLSLALAGWFLHAWLLARRAFAHISAGSLLLLPRDLQVPRWLWTLALLAAVVVLLYAVARVSRRQGIVSAVTVLIATAALALSIWLSPAHFTTSFKVSDVVRPGRYLAAGLLCLPALLCFAREAIMAARRHPHQ